MNTHTPPHNNTHSQHQLQDSNPADDLVNPELMNPLALASALHANNGPALHDVLFVDSRVADSASLLKGLKANTEVVYLQANGDGVQQMADYLAGHKVNSVQILAHGDEGNLWLGKTFVDNNALSTHSAALATIGQAIKPGGDILVYSCNLATGNDGAAFVGKLSALTGADVAAANHRIGTGGNWDLQISTGKIDATSVLSKDAESHYTHSLATLTVTSNADNGIGTLRNAISTASSGDTITFNAGMTITLSTGQLSIGQNLTIEGDVNHNGTAAVTINANYTGRAFNITAGNVTLDGLTITHGLLYGNGGNSNPTAAGGSSNGGAISNAGTLTLSNDTITANFATGGGGGGGVSSAYVGGGGGGGSGAGSTGGGTGGTASNTSGPLYTYPGLAGSNGNGGRGGSYNGTVLCGSGGTNSGGGAGGTVNALNNYAAGGAGATGTSNGVTIGGGGGGAGWDGNGGIGGSAAGAIYNTGTIYITGTSAITNNIGAGGGGGGGGGAGKQSGTGGLGVGGIWNAGGTIHITSSNYTAMTGNVGASGSSGGARNGASSPSAPTAVTKIYNASGTNDTSYAPGDITSATYDSSTGVLVVTGTGLNTGDTIDVSKLSLAGQGGSYTLTTPNVTASSTTSFTVTLNAADQININGILNKNGTTAVDTTTYNLAAAANWDVTEGSAADLTGNGVTVSNVTAPTITSATYNGTTNVLTVTGTGLVKTVGANNDITVNKLTFTGEGGATYTLSTSGNVEITSATSFAITLSGADIAGVNNLLNKNGTASLSGTTYNLAAADAWDSVVTGGSTADLTGNGITVSNATPIVVSATYDASTGILTVTGANMTAGDTIDVTKLALAGQGGSYTLTTPNVTAASSTSFSVTLNATDKININGILNKNGTAAVDTTVFNLAASANWDPTASSAADLTGNGVTVSNVAAPTITSATYNGTTNVLTVTGTGLVKTIGATNDVTVNKLTFTGEGGATYTLSASGNVEITSATSFSITLSGADIAGVNSLLNKNGTSSVSGTTYNLAAADDWDSVITGGDISVPTSAVTVSNVLPFVTSATYDASTGVLTVTGANMTAGDTIDVTKLALAGQGGSYTLTSPNVTAASSTSFSVTLNAADKININGILNKNGTAAVDTTVFNLAASANWDSTASSAADLTGNGVTVSNVTAPTITSATYDGTTNVLTVTGTGLVKTIGATNDVTVNKLTFTGEGGATYTLSTSGNVEITSATSFAITLSGADIAGVNNLLNKNGTSSISGTTYNLAAADAWDSVVTGGSTADLTGNGITVSNATPIVVSATYDASTGILTVTGANMTAGDTIDVTKLALAGQGGSYTLTSPNVVAASSTSFSVTLNATDKININGILNKNGTAAVDTTVFNLAASANWDPTASSAADLTGNGVTVSNVAAPTITSATYDGTTNVLTVTGTNLVKTIGATNDVTVNKLTFTGEGGATYTLSTSGNVEITSATSFAITLSGADIAGVNNLLNKNGTSSISGTTYNLAAADAWDSVVTGGSTADLTGNGITVSNATPIVVSATYDASTGILTVTGANMTAGDTIDVTKLALAGQGGSYTLTSPNVTAASSTSFSVTLNATDKVNINGILNKNGTAAVDTTTFNLAASANWDSTASSAADLTGNGVTVSNVAAPTITSATYDSSTHVLTVTGTGLVATPGATNDITVSKLTLKGEGGSTYTLTSGNVEVTSATSFSVTLNGADQAQVAQLFNKNGTASTNGTTYNLAAADDWDSVITGGDISVATTGITVSNVAVPDITSSTYNANTGVLTVTGTGFIGLNGAANDIVANKFSLQGEGGATYTLTTTSNVEITSATSFTLTLSAADRAGANLIMNKNGASSTSVNTYNLIAAEDWDAGADPAVVIADLAGNGITVTNVVAPTVTSATYNVATGVLVVTGNNMLSLNGANNDITANRIRFLGQGAFNYTLTNTPNVDITSGTSFTMTMSANDKAALALRLNKDGTSASDGTTYNIGMLEDWNTGAATAVVIADLFGNPVTVTGNNVPPSIGGVVAGQAVLENTTVSPFATVTITDPDAGASETIIITPDLAAKGAFTAASLAATGFSTADGGVTYTHAAGSPATVQAAIRGLVFQPASGRVAVGGTETTTFTISANDGIASAVLNNGTTVITTGVNAAPTDIQLSPATINQSAADNSTIGTLTDTDPNPGDTASFVLVSGDGVNDRDNGSFAISGSNTLVAKHPLGMTPGTYTVRVRAIDAGNLSFDKSLTITVADNVPPTATAISLVNYAVNNLSAVDYTVTFSETVNGVNPSAFTLATSGTVSASIASVNQVNGSTYLVHVNNVTGDGSLGLNLKAQGTGIVDTASLPLANGLSGASYQIMHTIPVTRVTTAIFSDDFSSSPSYVNTDSAPQTISGALSQALGDYESVQISIDGGMTWLTTTAVAGAMNWSVANISLQGKNTFEARVVDQAGNSSTPFAKLYMVNAGGTPNVTPNGDNDNDGIANSVEDNVPNLLGTGFGDGNGDGIADSLQKDVTSFLWNNNFTTPHYLTVANDQHAAIVKAVTTPTPSTLPTDLKLPFGVVSFEADGIKPGQEPVFTVYSENLAPVNGFWVQSKTGGWVNIATNISTVNGKYKVDFKVPDGGVFDGDGLQDGKVLVTGALGFKATSSANQNDVLHNSAMFVGQLYHDILFRDGDASGIQYWQQQLDTSHLSRAQVAASMLASNEFLTGVGGVTRLYFGAFNRLPDKDGLAYWLQQEKAGASLSSISGAFVASQEFQNTYGNLDNTGFVDRVYQNVLHRVADSAGKTYWLDQLSHGLSRGDLLAGFTESAEFKSASQSKVTLTLDYIGLLGHAPDQATFNQLLAQPNVDQVTLIGQFLNSPEYIARFS